MQRCLQLLLLELNDFVLEGGVDADVSLKVFIDEAAHLPLQILEHIDNFTAHQLYVSLNPLFLSLDLRSETNNVVVLFGQQKYDFLRQLL